MIKLSLYQPPGSTDYNKNLELMIKKIQSEEADFLVFPELYLTGYLIRDDLFKYKFNAESDVFKKIANLASKHNKHVIFGFPEYNDGYYNSAALISPNEKIDVVRKVYLPNFGPFEEHRYFKASDQIGTFNTEFGTIGMHICYDIFFPEISRIQALKGAQILFNISASPVTSRTLFENLMISRAIENTVFYVYNNWAGTQKNLVFWGGSRVISPRGFIIDTAPYFEEYTLNVIIDLEELKIARTLRPTLRDSRAELWKNLF